MNTGMYMLIFLAAVRAHFETLNRAVLHLITVCILGTSLKAF